MSLSALSEAGNYVWLAPGLLQQGRTPERGTWFIHRCEPFDFQASSVAREGQLKCQRMSTIHSKTAAGSGHFEQLRKLCSGSVTSQVTSYNKRIHSQRGP